MASAISAYGQHVDGLPSYHPAVTVSGVIRVWGHGNRSNHYLGALLRSLDAGFRKYQPSASLEDGMLGNASAIGGLYTGAADVALIDRRVMAIELDGYQQVFGYDPLEISVATGNLKVPNHSPALVIFVNKNNPLRQISLAQLDAIFGADHRRSDHNLREWGGLGLTGMWASRRITPYGFGIARAQSQTFERLVMKGSQKWNCDLHEFSDIRDEPKRTKRAGQAILDALAKDPGGIAFSTFEFRNSNVRAIPVSVEPNGRPVMPTEATLQSRAYPLTQTISVFVNRPPGKPLDPRVREFLSFVLSREGQRIIQEDGGYLPLTSDVVTQERRKIQ
ncbi:PstS family phosphate ABC transporter substrate-binding protein [Edaphobacter bradus]|uniref:PstS family phosphate ABC transporter substrate-binding protein n=1 Tax=Edaphobacter bradus TaxID=2259016 RepID=UPI0021E0738E|nr:substrate-binding domain-containing protein [Edaphobacter bradus]